MKEKIIRYGRSFLLFFILPAHTLYRYQLPFIEILDRLLYDAKVQLTIPGTMDGRIVILDIGEKAWLKLDADLGSGIQMAIRS